MVNSHSMDSLALDKISVQGFKSIASIKDLDLGRMNILIGSNGSGKSNFIGVFSFLHAIREGRLWLENNACDVLSSFIFRRHQ